MDKRTATLMEANGHGDYYVDLEGKSNDNGPFGGLWILAIVIAMLCADCRAGVQ